MWELRLQNDRNAYEPELREAQGVFCSAPLDLIPHRLDGDFVHPLARNSQSGRFALIGYMPVARTSVVQVKEGAKRRQLLSIYGAEAIE